MLPTHRVYQLYDMGKHEAQQCLGGLLAGQVQAERDHMTLV